MLNATPALSLETRRGRQAASRRTTPCIALPRSHCSVSSWVWSAPCWAPASPSEFFTAARFS